MISLLFSEHDLPIGLIFQMNQYFILKCFRIQKVFGVKYQAASFAHHNIFL